MADRAYRVVTLPGDGIGPEVVGQARDVLDAAGRAFGFSIDWTELLVGGAAIEAYGVPIRPVDLEVCRDADAILLGAVGGPAWSDPNATIRPEQALFALRGGFELFANLRPVTVHKALAASSPLRPELLDGVDLLIVRELTSGLYFGRPSEERQTADGRIAVDTLLYTEAEIRRVVRLAFQLAQGRGRKLTSVDKANVLATSKLWRRVATEVAGGHPGIALEHQLQAQRRTGRPSRAVGVFGGRGHHAMLDSSTNGRFSSAPLILNTVIAWGCGRVSFSVQPSTAARRSSTINSRRPEESTKLRPPRSIVRLRTGRASKASTASCTRVSVSRSSSPPSDRRAVSAS